MGTEWHSVELKTEYDTLVGALAITPAGSEEYGHLLNQLSSIVKINNEAMKTSIEKEREAKERESKETLERLRLEHEMEKLREQLEANGILEQMKIDAENERKAKEAEANKKKGIIDTAVNIGIKIIEVGVSTGVLIWGCKATLEYEKTGTILSFTGRNLLNSLFRRR